MNTASFNKIYSKISRKLLSISWLERLNINYNLVDETIKSQEFIEILGDMLEKKDYSCKKTLSLCRSVMERISYPNKPDDWMYYIYQHTLNYSFPEAVDIILIDSLTPACELYLRVLRIVNEVQKTSNDGTWQSLYPIVFLTPEEEDNLEYAEEYRKFLRAFRHNYTYEMMKLNGEVFGFNTLDHICGVHYLSLFIGRQLKKLDIPVDLGRVSGAAAGHDIGKYGCKRNELKRVPYLHYYYTDQWFRRYGINYIRNIALNHSTWDLELENLSIESLILIYSDFRVKNNGFGKDMHMHIFTLKDSFQVILDKLDNLDEKKEKRYKKVYEKLKDFEDFMLDSGVVTDLDIDIPNIQNSSKIKNYALMHGSDIVQNLKYLSIRHNINLMHELRDEYSLDSILEMARSETDWKNFREYIRIFEEYSTYLTQSQKLQTIRFLYENLVHPEDDIRRHCAELIGTLIAIFDEDYRKEIPENVRLQPSAHTSFSLFGEYLELMLSPGYKIIPSHRFRVGYSISIMANSLFRSCRKNTVPEYRKLLLKYYDEKYLKTTDSQVFLLETIRHIPLNPPGDELNIIYDFILSMLNKRNSSLRLIALEAAYELVPKLENLEYFTVELHKYLLEKDKPSSNPSENMLKNSIAQQLKIESLTKLFSEYCREDESKISDIFLSNLKTATDWVKKKNQISLLLQYSLNNIQNNGLHTAIHFCNLIKVSAVEKVRNSAGNAVLLLMPKLTLAERNEVAVELLRALEIEGNRFTEYIPQYIGQIILWLQPKELDEIIDDLTIKIKVSSLNVKSLILKTVGVALSNYSVYKERFMESEETYNNRIISMLGVLLNALGDYNEKVTQSAFRVIGKDLFGTVYLNHAEKQNIFKLIGKKILTMITDLKHEELILLSISAALNHIYRFISDFTFLYGSLYLPVPEKVAFFPGTFDPFSLSHKEIAKYIRDNGFEVYLAIDEFSWSKKTLPNLVRKQILSISIANELNIFIYPQHLPVNIANEDDLKNLKDNFKNIDVYIAVGSDVVTNASSYKAEKTTFSIHNFNHIIFERGKNKKLDIALKNIHGKVEILSLPSKYSDISSTQIRNYIDVNRDISSLVDPLAEEFIYENGFYQREPQDKSYISTSSLKVEIIETYNSGLANSLANLVTISKEKLENILCRCLENPSGRLVIIKDTASEDDIIGFSSFYWVRSNTLFGELQDAKVSQYLREKGLGRIIFINGFGLKVTDKYKGLEQILLTETLAFCLSKDYQFAIFKNIFGNSPAASVHELLYLQGFREIQSENYSKPTFAVNMSTPCVLNLDIENILKEPFRSNNRVKQIILSTRKNLQEALCRLYPGELVLSFDSSMLHHSMIRKICAENGVPTTVTTPRKLGSAMCVPYGDILDRYVIPNTVTKALHTEKFFNPTMGSFSIGEFPYYLNLPTQVKMIKSFRRPVILVDNILHKGYRIKALDPLLTNESIKVKKIICGILSGRGKDLMDIQNREVDCVYFIPRLRLWFNESSSYPFIGGDALWRGSFPKRNLLPSINLIMPYTSPNFIRNSSPGEIYNLSKVCLQNSLEILSTLENEYHVLNERNLTLLNLGQVFTIPRCPDLGKNIMYDYNLSPTNYIKNDMEQLTRFENIFNGF